MENMASQSLKICIYLYYARKKLPLLIQFQLKSGNFFLAQCLIYTNLQTLRGYIFHVLQHFATKLGNSTHFRMLFLTVVKDFVRLG